MEEKEGIELIYGKVDRTKLRQAIGKTIASAEYRNNEVSAMDILAKFVYAYGQLLEFSSRNGSAPMIAFLEERGFTPLSQQATLWIMEAIEQHPKPNA